MLMMLTYSKISKALVIRLGGGMGLGPDLKARPRFLKLLRLYEKNTSTRGYKWASTSHLNDVSRGLARQSSILAQAHLTKHSKLQLSFCSPPFTPGSEIFE